MGAWLLIWVQRCIFLSHFAPPQSRVHFKSEILNFSLKTYKNGSLDTRQPREKVQRDFNVTIPKSLYDS